MQTTGLVTKLNMKTKTNAGMPMKSPAYSILIDDATWYNMGFDVPTCAEGDVITFDYTESQYGREAKFSTVKIGEGQPQAKGSGSTVSGGVVRSDARQESIVFQSSLKVATDIIGIALANDCLTVPSKKADRLSMIVSAVREVAHLLATEAIAPDYSTFSTGEDVASATDE